MTSISENVLINFTGSTVTLPNGTQFSEIEALFIDSGDGNDTFNGWIGNDTLRSYGGNDSLNGGAGDDYLFGSSGVNTIVGGQGFDTLFFYPDSVSENVFVNNTSGTGTLPDGTQYREIEALYFLSGTGNDILNGSNANDSLSGGDGNDKLGAVYDGGTIYSIYDDFYDDAGNDTLNGGTGDDTLYGGDGDDRLGATSIFYDQFFSDPYRYIDDAGNDIVNGGTGNDILCSNAGNDTLSGGAGNDQFFYNTYKAFAAADVNIDTINELWHWRRQNCPRQNNI